ncbi:MAG TPA: hypothetical protein VIN40_07680 [Candidatus Tyrphobacter sp.]
MISNPALYRRRDKVLLWAVAFSLLIHVLGFLLYGAFRGYLPAWLHPRSKPEQIIVLSSSMRIEHRSVPQPARPMHRGSRPARSARPVAPQPQARPQRRIAVAPPVHRELTQPVPSASPRPQPRRSEAPAAQTFAQRLAREQSAFAREVAQLRRQNNPLSVATIAPRPASAYRRTYFNISGIQTPRSEHVEGIVTPIRSWREGALHCYYANYNVEFSNGSGDSGEIPWPLCYPPDHDVMQLPSGSPIPAIDLFPMEGYVLPAGTYLTHFLRELYNRNTP